MRGDCTCILAWCRKARRTSDAKRICDQFVTLGERLAVAYPEQTATLLLLSEAYDPRAKNFYLEEGDNERAIDEWGKKRLTH